ncbi:hypothetical protein CDAR_321611 [Caerostris darwini]|uniref:Uncharacterized protein n=1 Tax=Caerostris darwini TaxID=1538125 RepID=A0AAV4VTP8_9ARAC|nr:hypothetical protein CDAR_321611 [Caerostris darwini]
MLDKHRSQDTLMSSRQRCHPVLSDVVRRLLRKENGSYRHNGAELGSVELSENEILSIFIDLKYLREEDSDITQKLPWRPIEMSPG